jgi:Antitoxin FitA-like, ribbon-helix-helix
MPTLYVENVPSDLYEALREQAKQKRKSIAEEVIALLERTVPTAKELARRERFYKQLKKLRAQPSPGQGPLSSTEEMQREDRER